MRLYSVVWCVALCEIMFGMLVVAVAPAGKKKSKKKKGGGPCELTARELEKTFNVSCPDGVIFSLSVVGHSGPQCQGLTPDLFVQMNSCFWKKNCTLSYSTKAVNYMLKLYKGKMRECVTKTPEKFTINYSCTKKKKVKRLHIVRRSGGEKKSRKTKKLKDKQGVIVSHRDHPWLYRRHQSQSVREALTLHRPKKKLKEFYYTIRTLSLMAGDNLTVNWTLDGENWTNKTFPADHDLTSLNQRSRSISEPERVVFSLDTSHYTTGGEGFVICFRWAKPPKKARKPSDQCKKLIKVAGGCSRKKTERKNG